MSSKEKGRRRGDPIPNNVVRQDKPESKPTLRYLQAVSLTRRCAISLAMAAIVAPLLHGEARQ
jgi:hypothetical protein